MEDSQKVSLFLWRILKMKPQRFINKGQINKSKVIVLVKIIGVIILCALFTNCNRFPVYKTIHEAAKEGDIRDVRRHLRKGADVNAMDSEGLTPLFYAGSFTDMEDRKLAKLLIKNGADVNAKENNTGYTNLHYASRFRSPEQVKFWIDMGANVNIQDENGMTPLICAIMGENIENLRILIDKGADVNLRSENDTPLGRAYYNYLLSFFDNSVEKKAESQSISKSMMELLIKAGADVNAKKRDNKTLLHTVVRDDRGHTEWDTTEEIIELLIEKGADINARDSDGDTPLHIAAMEGNVNMCGFLVRHGANQNIRNNRGELPYEILPFGVMIKRSLQRGGHY